MGISFSCPLAAYTDLENGLESVIIKSISFGNDESKTPVRSISFRTRESEPTIFQSKGIGKMAVEGSISLETTETETKISITAPPHTEMNIQMDNQSPRSDTTEAKVKQLLTLDLSNPKHEAAIKLQKVYKSFRTRRKLADCAVLIEQSWWKLLDFAELKRSSISFFDIEKHETAISRWSRARTRAAKVGKGLSKNSRAQKLALQHWLEAIDPRHRYGHNLHFYFVKWLHSQSKEPFFYWLDIGEGKEVNLVDKCPRSKLQQQCIKYLGPMERKAYEVIVEDGKFIYKQSGELLDTTREPKGAKWIFVLSTSMNLYVGLKKKGTFQHSSFLAGGATSAAGRIIVENGSLKAVWPHSGHYRPTPENFQDFISFLRGNNVDLTDIKMDPADDEEESSSKRNNVYFRSISSDEDLAEKDRLEREEMETEENSSEKMNLSEEEENANASELPPQMRSSRSLKGKLTNLSIPDRDDLFEELKHKNQTVSNALSQTDSSPGSYATAQNEMVIEQDLSDDDVEDNRDEGILKESILERINSHKGMNSYQLGKQLSFKWTTGAGPRIGCLRDYPPKLQFRALEKVKLSPRCAIHYRSKSSRDVLVNSFSGEIDIKNMSFSGELPRTKQCTSQFSPLCKGFSASGDEELS